MFWERRVRAISLKKIRAIASPRCESLNSGPCLSGSLSVRWETASKDSSEKSFNDLYARNLNISECLSVSSHDYINCFLSRLGNKLQTNQKSLEWFYHRIPVILSAARDEIFKVLASDIAVLLRFLYPDFKSMNSAFCAINEVMYAHADGNGTLYSAEVTDQKFQMKTSK